MVRNTIGFFHDGDLDHSGSRIGPRFGAGDPIGAVDNIPPEAPSNIAAVADLGVPNVTVTWDLSPSDGRSFNSTDGGSGSVVAVNDVESYIIRMSESFAEAVEIGRVAPGQKTYVDDTVENGPLYIYEVSAFDGTNESDAIASFPVSIGDPPSASIQPSDLSPFSVVAANGTVSKTLSLFNGGPGTLTVGFEYDPEGGFRGQFRRRSGDGHRPRRAFRNRIG